jgi:hypothetical protein
MLDRSLNGGAFTVKWRRKVAVFLALVVLCLSLAAVGRAEELVIAQYPDSNYPPGPGWPPGWTPPPVPELSERTRKSFEDFMKKFPKFTRFEIRVLEPMPKWTNEYPYRWELERVECGNTVYAFWYPSPDSAIISQVYDRSMSGGKSGSSACRFEPIRYINEAKKQSPEARELEARFAAYFVELKNARRGLGLGFGDDVTGKPENIAVFFNHGEAHRQFDVPAYLDASVGRVRVPIRFVSELMGAEVTWNEEAEQVTIHFPPASREVDKVSPLEGYSYADLFHPESYYPDAHRFQISKQTVSTPERTILFTIGQPTATVDGKEVALDAPPVIKEGRTMVPVRFIAEQMGAKVYWIGDKPFYNQVVNRTHGPYQVHIFTPFFPLYDYPSWYLETYGVKF